VVEKISIDVCAIELGRARPIRLRNIKTCGTLNQALKTWSFTPRWPKVSMTNRIERRTWNFADSDGRTGSITRSPCPAMDDMASRLISVVAGVGVAFPPEEFATVGIPTGN